ncbi:hypothetical protein [Sphingobium sp. WCS2017Hpa-17]|uniref:hypothetical protein n=1 Tax=Sphingobium sp. WCS2017Hpa-17 TaxID=3073638 RepID=UPI00288B60F2|nr:hypothetical protein [Sphingobium sp. WCS2017Hpa-17]
MASGASPSDHMFRQSGGVAVSYRVMQAIFCLQLAMSAAVAWAQVPAKSAMTVGAIVVKPCQISDRDSENMCHTNIRKTMSDVASHIVAGDAAISENLSNSRFAFVEYEF